jgi:Helicase conserved C-terminal domain
LLGILHVLENCAIAFDTMSEQGRLLFIPENIFESMKKGAIQKEAEIVQYELVPTAEPPAVQPAQSTLLYDLAVIVGATYQQMIEPTQAGAVPKRIANKIQPLLHGQNRSRYSDGSDEYLDMLFNIAREMSVLRLVEPSLEGLKQHYEPDPKLQQWAQLSIVEQTWKLVQCWFNSFSWLDIRGFHFKQWDVYYWNPNLARKSILEQLVQCTPGVWYSTASLLDKLWDKDPFELRPVRYNIRPADKQKTAAYRARWNNCEGEVYLGLIGSTLFEMGIVSLGYQHSNLSEAHHHMNPDSFMLTDLGARILFKFVAQMMEEQKASGTTKKSASTKTKMVVAELAPLSEMPTSAGSVNSANGADGADGHRSLVLQPNFELLLLEPDMPTLYSLLPFAQVNQVEMVSRLTLTRNSVLRGLQAGKTVDQIMETLALHSQKEVPQNVAYTLRDWVKLYKDVKVTQVFLLEVSNDSVADELCASPKLAAFNLRKIAPCLLVAASDVNLQELRRVLDKEGIAVRLSGKIVTPQSRYSYNYNY